MNRHLTALAFTVWVTSTLSPYAARAQSGDEQSYEKCQDKAGGVIPSMKECDGAELQRRDAMLNQLYQELLHTVKPERQELLRRAERAWLAFMEAECAFSSSAEAGGMDEPIVYNGCRLELTAQRVERLKKALDFAQFVDRLGKPHGPNARRPP